MSRGRKRSNVIALPTFERPGRDYYMVVVADVDAPAPRLVQMRFVDDPRTLDGRDEEAFVSTVLAALGLDDRGVPAVLVFDDESNCKAAYRDVLAMIRKRTKNAHARR